MTLNKEFVKIELPVSGWRRHGYFSPQDGKKV